MACLRRCEETEWRGYVKHKRDARDEHWFVTEASRLCPPLFHRVPRRPAPRGSCRQGGYLTIKVSRSPRRRASPILLGQENACAFSYTLPPITCRLRYWPAILYVYESKPAYSSSLSLSLSLLFIYSLFLGACIN